MLPAPISFASRRRRGFTANTINITLYHYWRNKLLIRSRITNLTVFLLLFFLFVSILAHLRVWLLEPSSNDNDVLLCLSGRRINTSKVPKSIEGTISIAKDDVRQLNHLIMVPGHAIWTGSKAEEVSDEDYWLLESYQRGGGRVDAFVEHIRRGAELAEKDEQSLLIFSGGQTRISSHGTESTSYLSVAQALQILPISTSQSRVTTENFALDSFQNLLFSIARYYEVVGRYPEKITIVGYEMKKRRFEELHREALRLPYHGESWDYIGNNPGTEHLEKAYEGERINGYIPYTKDMYGCHGELLSKRRSRNVFNRFHPYHSSNPDLVDLLEWCPPTNEDGKDISSLETIFSGPLPWDQ